GAGAIGRNVANQGAFARRELESLGEIFANGLDDDAEVAAGDFAGLEDLLHDAASHVDGNSEADAEIAAVAAVDGGSDADELAAGIDERAAGIAGVDGGVGLDEVGIAAGRSDFGVAAAGGADDAERHGFVKAERIADGHGDVADAELAGIAELH